MIKYYCKSLKWSVGVISVIFTFVPESVFGSVIRWDGFCSYVSKLFEGAFNPGDLNVIANHLLCLIVIHLFLLLIVTGYYKCFRKTVTIKGNDYIVKVKYGNIFKEKNCKMVISFDECFTTIVGDAPWQIKPTSICGQYLKTNPSLDISHLIAKAGIIAASRKSKYRKQDRYTSGTIVPNNNDLLLAFVPLDKDGRGVFSSYEEYLTCLFALWKELEKHYAQQDVCISILGAGLTRIGNGMGSCYSQQELLNMIVKSYQLSPYKLKKPAMLRIVCQRCENFSLENVGL